MCTHVAILKIYFFFKILVIAWHREQIGPYSSVIPFHTQYNQLNYIKEYFLEFTVHKNLRLT